LEVVLVGVGFGIVRSCLFVLLIGVVVIGVPEMTTGFQVLRPQFAVGGQFLTK
jgi:hypothetical protein